MYKSIYCIDFQAYTVLTYPQIDSKDKPPHNQHLSPTRNEVLNAILKKYLGIEVAAVAAHYILTSSSPDISTTLLLPTS